MGQVERNKKFDEELQKAIDRYADNSVDLTVDDVRASMMRSIAVSKLYSKLWFKPLMFIKINAAPILMFILMAAQIFVCYLLIRTTGVINIMTYLVAFSLAYYFVYACRAFYNSFSRYVISMKAIKAIYYLIKSREYNIEELIGDEQEDKEE